MQTRRRFLTMTSMAAVALPLAACDQVTPDQVVSGIKSACGVVADVVAIAALIGTFSAGTTAATIVTAFCNAMHQQGKLGSASVVVNGKQANGGTVTVNGIVVPYAVP